MPESIEISRLRPGMKLSRGLDRGPIGVALPEGYVFRPSSISRRTAGLAKWGYERVWVYADVDYAPRYDLLPVSVVSRRLLRKERDLNYIRDEIRKEAEKLTENLSSDRGLSDLQVRYLTQVVRQLVESELFEEFFAGFIRYDTQGMLILEHSLNVMYYAMLLSLHEKRAHVDRKQIVTDIGTASFLHDVGYLKRLSIPWWEKQGDDYLRAAGRSLRFHVDQIEPELRRLTDAQKYIGIVRHHHSYLDGTGYPERPAAGVSEYTQMVQVCDIYDIDHFRYKLNGAFLRVFPHGERINMAYFDSLSNLIET